MNMNKKRRNVHNNNNKDLDSHMDSQVLMDSLLNLPMDSLALMDSLLKLLMDFLHKVLMDGDQEVDLVVVDLINISLNK